MAKQIKLFCDRCKKDISKDMWRYNLKLPRRITLKAVYEDGYSIHDCHFDLCEDCGKKVLRILEGKEDGK